MFGSSPRVRGKPSTFNDSGGVSRLIPARAGKTTAQSGKDAKERAHPRACGENCRGGSKTGRRGGSSPRVRGKQRRGAGGAAHPVAHPRACGENEPGLDLADPASGSSPRVRGKRRARSRSSRCTRLIPARAGKTTMMATIRTRRPAHPRACGENLRLVGDTHQRRGSSPRVRGKRRNSAGLQHSPGLIPARAGKTVFRPRLNGLRAGSSPRVRGKLMSFHLSPSKRRLIPARAGKTRVDDEEAGAWTAHPRACGENAHAIHTLKARDGSSPRVRGKPRPASRGGRRKRLIPARAGKTPRSTTISCPAAAHPRACGENCRRCARTRRGPGSSPRVRGKLGHILGGRIERGLIPARAGKTSPPSGTCRRRRAHPRACGENRVMLRELSIAMGSSPRVRGKPHPPARGRAPPGLIPARAGKTAPRARSQRAPTAHPRACGENLMSHQSVGARPGSSPRVRGKHEVKYLTRN